jgi:hypothetical protein
MESLIHVWLIVRSSPECTTWNSSNIKKKKKAIIRSSNRACACMAHERPKKHLISYENLEWINAGLIRRIYTGLWSIHMQSTPMLFSSATRVETLFSTVLDHTTVIYRRRHRCHSPGRWRAFSLFVLLHPRSHGGYTSAPACPIQTDEAHASMAVVELHDLVQLRGVIV